MSADTSRSPTQALHPRHSHLHEPKSLEYAPAMGSSPDRRIDTPIEHVLTLGPWLVILVWILAGQWNSGNPESRAWLVLTGIVGAAWLLPLPVRTAHVDVRHGLRWWGWAVVAGLLATS